MVCVSLCISSQSFGKQSSTTSSSTHKSTGTSSAAPAKSAKKTPTKTAATHKRKRRISPRVARIRQAFVASASLRPMAQQLLQERTPAAYAGVTAYAQKHSKEDAGALAWLAIGYAHILDHDYAKAIDPLNHARPRAGDLGDYVAYYLGSSYLQTGRTAEAVATLSDFSQKYPDSLLLLERDRVPSRADIELGLGRAYAALGQTAKAVGALRNVYYRMPTSS